MARSNAAINSCAFPAVSDAANPAITAAESRAGSAAKQTATEASSKARRVISRPIARVDADVALREVAGPEARLAFAFSPNVDANLAVRRVELLLEVGLGKRRGNTALADRDALHVDIGLRGIERDTGIARRG